MLLNSYYYRCKFARLAQIFPERDSDFHPRGAEDTELGKYLRKLRLFQFVNHRWRMTARVLQ
jgi:hypothetical protein